MNKANNLKLGAIYINGITGTPCRLITIVPCEGVWMETFDGQGYGETIKFDDVFYADVDEVQDYLDDLAVWKNSATAPSHKEEIDSDIIVQRGFVAEDDEYICGYYNDNEGNDIRCRD